MQFDNYSIYSINAGVVNKTDFVDEYVYDLTKLKEYSDVREYILSKFGDVSGEKWLEYPEIDKKIFLSLDEEKAEFCALRHNQQYFGQGWKLINNEE